MNIVTKELTAVICHLLLLITNASEEAAKASNDHDYLRRRSLKKGGGGFFVLGFDEDGNLSVLTWIFIALLFVCTWAYIFVKCAEDVASRRERRRVLHQRETQRSEAEAQAKAKAPTPVAVNETKKPQANSDDTSGKDAKKAPHNRSSNQDGKTSPSVTEEDKQDIARWRGFVSQGIPPPVCMALMDKEGFKKELRPLVFANNESVRPREPQKVTISLTPEEGRAVMEAKMCLQPDEDGDLVFPPAITVFNIRNRGLDPKLIPIIFQGYKPADGDGTLMPKEVEPFKRYRSMLARGMNVVELARLMHREDCDNRVFFLVFSEFYPALP